MMASSYFLILLVVIAAASTRATKFHGCSGVQRGRCEVSEVRVSPCKLRKGSCELTRGENASISFDFTPSFSASSLKTGIFYQDMPFSDMNDNGCELTTCPTVAGTAQTLTYNLYIADKFPKGKYNINFKVWNEADAQNDICCFTTAISIPGKTK